MAMALLAHHLDAAGRRGAGRPRPGPSAGADRPPTTPSRCWPSAGIDLSDHTSRRLDGTRGATGRPGARHDPRPRRRRGGPRPATPAYRTFVIGELVRLRRRGRAPPTTTRRVRQWSSEVARRRRPGRPSGQLADEVADPVGEGLEVYRRTADRLEGLSEAIAELLVPFPERAQRRPRGLRPAQPLLGADARTPPGTRRSVPSAGHGRAPGRRRSARGRRGGPGVVPRGGPRPGRPAPGRGPARSGRTPPRRCRPGRP